MKALMNMNRYNPLSNSLGGKSFRTTVMKAFSQKKVDPFGGMKLKDPIPNPNRLQGKVAIITGGSSGIGKASCELFQKNGITGLMVADLDEKNGKELVEKMNSERKEKFAEFLKVDVTSSNSLKNMVDQTVKRFGKLNIMFNNAGIMHPDDDGPVTTEEKIWDLTMNVNLKSVYLCCKHGIPEILKSGGGSIINVASLVAVMGSATPQLAYTASKGGVLAMTREMAIIYARQNLRINSLCPGPIRTDLLMKFLDTDEKLNRRLVHIPIGRFGETKEIAQAVAFLASDESSFITGSTFLVDGGITQAYVTPQ
jgi:NAD(P)-dependent dehydrogenase (short-subunit alcohol dehydrogenase family)